MKRSPRLPTAKAAMAATVLVALLGQQVAAARGGSYGSHEPGRVRSVHTETESLTQFRPSVVPFHASSSMTKEEALNVIATAENRTVESYFLHGGTTDDLQRFDNDLKVLAQANAKVGIANDINNYQTWWATNKTPHILGRGKLQTRNLQGFFTETFIDYKRSDNNPSALPSWLSGVINNPTVIQVSLTSFMVIYGTASFFGSIIRGAMIAGPAAGVIGALVDPAVRPFRENASTAGSRLLGGLGVKINEWFARRSRVAAAKQLLKLHEGVDGAESSVARARARVLTQGYDYSADDYATNLEYLQSGWGETNRVWGNINNSIFKDGRSLVTDWVVNRPLNFALNMATSTTAVETFHQGIAQNIDRIIARTGLPWQLVDQSARDLMAAIDRAEQSDVVDVEKAQSEVQQARQALLTLGAGQVQVDEIISGRSRELAFARQLVGVLAANFFHDEQYEEANRSLPDVIRGAQVAMRKSLSIDYFHLEYRAKVVEILNAMNYKINLARETLAVADAKLASPRTTFAGDKPDKLDRNRNKFRSRIDKMRSGARALLRLDEGKRPGQLMCSDIFKISR